MPRHLITRVALAGLISISIAGCGSDPADDEEPDPAVAWAEKVCSQVHQGSKKLQLPNVDPEKPARVKDGLVGFLDTLAAELDELGRHLKKQGAPPVEGGKATLDKALQTLDDTRSEVESATKSLKSAQVSDPASLKTALSAAGKDGIANLGSYQGPTKDLRKNPALNAAFGKAPTCKQLNSGA